MDGKTRTLENVLEGGPAVLVFFKNTCPTCQYALPFFERVHQGKAKVVGISQDGPEDTAEFAAEYGLRFPMLLDSAEKGYQASNEYGISYVPSIFLVEGDGKIAMAWDGFSKADMEELGERVKVEVFGREENVPAWKAG
jgi:peroxiredoxin